MIRWWDIDWRRMFLPSQPILETLIRGSCMYLALFGLLRFFRRQTGSLGAADLLVLLLIADAAQNGMAGEYKSITDGVLLVGTIIFWEWLLDWSGFRFKSMRGILERTPLLLIENGQVRHGNLRSEMMTVDELISHLRQKGVADPSQVRLCFLEGDGHISVITRDGNEMSLQTEEPVQH